MLSRQQYSQKVERGVAVIRTTGRPENRQRLVERKTGIKQKRGKVVTLGRAINTI